MDLEGVGGPARDFMFQYLLAALSNTIGGGKYVDEKTRKPYQLDEFVLPWQQNRAQPEGRKKSRSLQRDKDERLTPDQTREHVAGIMAMFGGVDPAYAKKSSMFKKASKSAT